MNQLELITYSELVDKLIIINIRLFKLLDRTMYLEQQRHQRELTDSEKHEIIILSGQNIELVKQRSNLRQAIDKKLQLAIKNGDVNILQEFKAYGYENWENTEMFKEKINS